MCFITLDWVGQFNHLKLKIFLKSNLTQYQNLFKNFRACYNWKRVWWIKKMVNTFTRSSDKTYKTFYLRKCKSAGRIQTFFKNYVENVSWKISLSLRICKFKIVFAKRSLNHEFDKDKLNRIFLFLFLLYKENIKWKTNAFLPRIYHSRYLVVNCLLDPACSLMMQIILVVKWKLAIEREANHGLLKMLHGLEILLL